MAKNQEKAPGMQSSPAVTETNSSTRKRKAEMLISEAPPVGDVKEPLTQFLFEERVTRHSDVNDENYENRIIIPKAEQFFGEFAKLTKSSDIDMDDIGTGKVKFWFRSWEKDGIRTYVLEGTRKYKEEENIQVADFIMLYKDNQTDKYLAKTRLELDDLPLASSQVDISERNEVQSTNFEVSSIDEYPPQFLPPDETSQILQATNVMDEEYVLKNFNMTWDGFINYNPFDY